MLSPAQILSRKHKTGKKIILVIALGIVVILGITIFIHTHGLNDKNISNTSNLNSFTGEWSDGSPSTRQFLLQIYQSDVADTLYGEADYYELVSGCTTRACEKTGDAIVRAKRLDANTFTIDLLGTTQNGNENLTSNNGIASNLKQSVIGNATVTLNPDKSLDWKLDKPSQLQYFPLSVQLQKDPQFNSHTDPFPIYTNFSKATEDLRRNTSLPVPYPTDLLANFKLDPETPLVYITISTSTDSYYIKFTFSPACGSDACSAGYLSAKKGSKALPKFVDGKTIELTTGVMSSYKDRSCGGSCSPPTIFWNQNNIHYEMQMNMDLSSMLDLARRTSQNNQ